ncbi:MAG TPA: hypothetical protein VEW69_09020, partial [Alphaproteobacteria bacterium]|nr:hypothetical protein [Alphaproteobacteria bacterium]
EAIEAGGTIEPGKYAFCTKICSKIICAQFCIVILNNDIVQMDGKATERPNANVNMEYGLVLGHNKYVIPFQREDQALPFNVSGLDTIKYNSSNFSALAGTAIEQAIRETNLSAPASAVPLDQMVIAFCLSKDATFVNIQDMNERVTAHLGLI